MLGPVRRMKGALSPPRCTVLGTNVPDWSPAPAAGWRSPTALNTCNEQCAADEWLQEAEAAHDMRILQHSGPAHHIIASGQQCPGVLDIYNGRATGLRSQHMHQQQLAECTAGVNARLMPQPTCMQGSPAAGQQ